MTDEAMKAMARRIASTTKVGAVPQDIFDGIWDNSPVVRAALAAIIETQESCAGLADRRVSQIKALYSDDIGMSDARVACQLEAEQFAAAIRSGQQFRKDV